MNYGIMGIRMSLIEYNFILNKICSYGIWDELTIEDKKIKINIWLKGSYKLHLHEGDIYDDNEY